VIYLDMMAKNFKHTTEQPILSENIKCKLDDVNLYTYLNHLLFSCIKVQSLKTFFNLLQCCEETQNILLENMQVFIGSSEIQSYTFQNTWLYKLLWLKLLFYSLTKSLLGAIQIIRFFPSASYMSFYFQKWCFLVFYSFESLNQSQNFTCSQTWLFISRNIKIRC
jgi:hypothetical protein